MKLEKYFIHLGLLCFVIALMANTILLFSNPTSYSVAHGFVTIVWIFIGWILIYLGLEE